MLKVHLRYNIKKWLVKFWGIAVRYLDGSILLLDYWIFKMGLVFLSIWPVLFQFHGLLDNKKGPIYEHIVNNSFGGHMSKLCGYWRQMFWRQMYNLKSHVWCEITLSSVVFRIGIGPLPSLPVPYCSDKPAHYLYVVLYD